MRKYNPNLKGMVDNYRLEAKKVGLNTEHFTDEQIYAVIDMYSGMSTPEEQLECVLDDIRIALES